MKGPPLRQVKETLGTLTAVLADITTQVDHLTHGELRRSALSAQPGTRAGENPSVTPSTAPSACFDPLSWDDPTQMHAPPISMPRESRSTNSVDINLPTPPDSLPQPHLHTGSGSRMDTSSIAPGPNLAPGVASTPCISTRQVTISTQQVTPCLVTPVSRLLHQKPLHFTTLAPSQAP